MRILTGLVMLAALGATAASAQPGRVSDAGYLQAARCAGLASSANLGASDGAAMSAWLKSQAPGRMSYILDKADEIQRKAKRDADRADDFAKPRLSAELTGACAQFKS